MFGPDPDNLDAYVRYRSRTDRFADICKPTFRQQLCELYRGRGTLIEQRAGQTVFLPGGTVHAVFTVSASASLNITWRRLWDLPATTRALLASRRIPKRGKKVNGKELI